MKNHVFRPLFVVIGFVIAVLAFRMFYVPRDFGVHERGYMYGWYRENSVEFWKTVKVKYVGKDYCAGCHPEKTESIGRTPHAVIQCENCHGPANDSKSEHPSEQRPKLQKDRSRALCLRCHLKLPYPSSGRAKIRGINPALHNPDIECVTCHDPHSPTPEGAK